MSFYWALTTMKSTCCVHLTGQKTEAQRQIYPPTCSRSELGPVGPWGLCSFHILRGHWGLGTDSIRKPGKAQRTPTGVSASHRLLIPRGQRFRAVCRAAEPYVLPTADKAQRSLGLSLPQSEALFDSVWEGFVRQRGVEVQDCRKRLSSALSQETLVL